jgi:integrase
MISGPVVLLAYRHGLGAAEVVDLRWEQVDFKSATLSVRRVKQGAPSSHPLTGRELRELRRHLRESGGSPFVFVSERGAPRARYQSQQIQPRPWRTGQCCACDCLRIVTHPVAGTMQANFIRSVGM